jgi:hypothetical protein
MREDSRKIHLDMAPVDNQTGMKRSGFFPFKHFKIEHARIVKFYDKPFSGHDGSDPECRQVSPVVHSYCS